MEVLLALGIALVVKGCAEAYSLAQGASNTEETTPTIYEPPQRDDNWYRAESTRTEAEIAYLVKQEELRETREWLARRR